MPTFPSTLFPLRRRARIVIAAVLTLSAAIAALLCFSGLRDFSLESATTRTLTFHAGSDRLSGTLILPRDVAAPPVALFVHGDGPQDRYADDGYLPFINQLLDQGIGVFTWDKPGVGRSAGNWLDQSMQDRAAEAMAAYLRVRSEPGVDAAKVGFLGYSQAGWVLPIVVSRAQPAFTVIIGGAVNWRDQGAYYTRKRLQAQGVAADEIERRLAAERTRNDALFGEPRPQADVLAARPDMTPRAPLRATQLSVGCVRLDPENARPGAGRVGRDGPERGCSRERRALSPAVRRRTGQARHAGARRRPRVAARAAIQRPDRQRLDALEKLRFMLLGREAYVQPAVRDIADWIRQAAAGH